MQNFENLPLFVIVTAEKLHQAKADGTYPLARIMFLESEEPNPDTHVKSIYYAEIFTNPDAGWITKGSRDHQIQPIEQAELKHAMWAAVEVYYQKRHVVMEHGCHILDVDLSKKPEAIVGAVAAWCTNPKFAKYAPEDGYAILRGRNVGGGNVHYMIGDEMADGQETKHEYEDMLLSGAANFRLFIPVWLTQPRVNDDGSVGGSWMEEVIAALTLDRDASNERSHQNAIVWNINNNAYQRASRTTAAGITPKDEALVVNSTEPDQTIDLLKIGPQRIFVYSRNGSVFTMLRGIYWDSSDFAKNLVNDYRKHYFSLKAL